MKKFKIKQDKSTVYMVIGCLVSLGVLFLATNSLGIPFSPFFQFVGVIFFVAAVYLMNGYVLSEYFVEIDDLASDVSNYPKIYIYSTRNHNIAHKSVFVSANRIISIERVDRIIKNDGVRFSNLCANIKPKDIYMITYHESGEEMRIFADFDSEVYLELKKRVDMYSGLSEEDYF